MSDIADTKPKIRFFEGGNGIAIIAIPICVLLCALFYRKVVAFVAPFQIKIEDVYIYVFSLFAVQFAALLALFALFVCKPTAFLERIKGTHAFAAIVATTRITMSVVTLALALTFVFGIIRLEPEHSLTLHSWLFLAWVTLAATATAFYARTVSLIFTALD